MIYIYNSNSKFYKQIEYVFMNIFHLLGLEYSFDFSKKNNLKTDDILIIYDECEESENYKNYFENIIIIEPSRKIFTENYLKRESIPNTVKIFNTKNSGFINEDVISIFNNDTQLYIQHIRKKKKVIKTNIDIISDIFFMLTRYEEVVKVEAYKNEKYKRFPVNESLAFKNNFLDRPIVNEHIELLWSLIDSLNLGYKKKQWWEEKDFGACLTHDVDMVIKFKSLKNIIRPCVSSIVKKKDIRKVISMFSTYLSKKRNYKKDPFWTFDYFMDIEKKYNFQSSFYFMSGGTSEFDNFYKIRDEKVLNLINDIEKEGFEAGYHCSFNSYNNFEIMKKEKNILDELIGNKPYGCRQHFLRFQAPFTWRYQEKVGVLYDTTLSYADAEGFRCGTCFPFKPYDLLENRIINIFEIPLIVMDASLQNPNYKSYTPEQGLNKTKTLIDLVKKYNGVFTILYHNSSFDPYNSMWDGWKETYEKTMEYLWISNCYGTSGREIIKIINR